MIIYGWKSTDLKKSPELGEACVKCGKHTTQVAVTASYFHVFWIPVFPYRKTYEVDCSSCNYIARPNELPEKARRSAKSLKRSVRAPLYMYSGIILIILAIAYVSYNIKATEQQYLDYIDNPQANDIYHLYKEDEPTEYKYSLWKVTEVAGDTVYVSPNSFQYNFIPSKLEDEDGFFDVQYIMNKSDVRDLFEEDVIRQVDRGFKAGSGFERQIEYTGEDSLESN